MTKKIIIGLIITAAVITGLVIAIPPREVLPYFRSANIWYFIAACLVNMLSVAFRARRWQLIASPLKSTGFLDVFRYFTLGLAVNAVIPLRAGEAMRSYAMSVRWNMTKREAVSTVLVDRSFDVVSFGLLVMLAARLFDLPGSLGAKTTSLAITSLAVAISFPVFAQLGKTFRNRREEEFSSRFQRTLADKLEPLSRGYSALTPRTVAQVFPLSLLAIMLHVLVARLAAASVGVDLPFGGLVIAVLAVNAASGVPLTPANVGLFQVAFLLPLSLYGIDKSSAVAVGTIFQGALVLPVVVVGLAAMLYEKKREDAGNTAG
ncbi:MAG: lysylphosphatidylglycerol synthase transmembrane domain-containing protein [bacterium]|jgi:uncharacterized protein (TIRG00374 family)